MLKNLLSATALLAAVGLSAANVPDGAYEATYANMQEFTFLGWRSSSHYDVGMKFSDPSLKGMKVVGAKVVGLMEQGTEAYKLWSVASLPEGDVTGNVADMVQDGTEATAMFPEPVVLGDDPVYFGFSFDVIEGSEDTGWPVPCCESGTYTNEGIRFRCTEDYTWDNLSLYGALPIVLYVTGDIPQGSLQVNGCNATLAGMPNGNIEVPIKVVNYSGEEVTNLDITYTVNGQSNTFSTQLDQPLSHYMTLPQKVVIPMTLPQNPGNYTVPVTIEKVNGKTNTWAKKSVDVPMSVAAFATTKRPFMEEATGTTCGYCPRGAIGMQELGKRYPEFIAAAYHKYDQDDPMFIAVKEPWSYKGYPNSTLDRRDSYDPYYGSSSNTPLGIAQDYEERCQEVAPADIELSAYWNADQTEIKVDASAKFAMAEPGKTYKLGYSLTIDGLSHPELEGWHQINYYENETSADSLINLLGSKETFDPDVFNHVIFYRLSTTNINLKSSTIVIGKEYTDSRSIKLSANQLFHKADWSLADEDLSKVNVIAMLVDNDGYVRNARKVRIDNTTTGIGQINAPAQDTPAVFYDIMGRKVANPQHGLYIRVYNGKTEKIIL